MGRGVEELVMMVEEGKEVEEEGERRVEGEGGEKWRKEGRDGKG